MAKNKLYQLQFITSPNDGFYEATIKMKNGIPSLGGELVESTLMEISHIASQTNFHFYGSIVTTYRKKALSQMYRETTSTPGAFEREIERAVLHG